MTCPSSLAQSSHGTILISIMTKLLHRFFATTASHSFWLVLLILNFPSKGTANSVCRGSVFFTLPHKNVCRTFADYFSLIGLHRFNPLNTPINFTVLYLFSYFCLFARLQIYIGLVQTCKRIFTFGKIDANLTNYNCYIFMVYSSRFFDFKLHYFLGPVFLFTIVFVSKVDNLLLFIHCSVYC